MTLTQLEQIIKGVDAELFAEFFVKGIALQQQATFRAKATAVRDAAQKTVQDAEQAAQELEKEISK